MVYPLGIDLGTTSVRVAIMQDGQPVIIKNAEGSGTTPSCVGRNKDGAWVVGSAAQKLALEDPSNVAFSTKRIIGRNIDDAEVKKLARQVPFQIVGGPKGEALVELGGEAVSPTEIAAILLKKLKRDAETYLGAEATQAVITVPAYFDDTQRRATRDAAQIAGLEVLRLESEPVMAALDYSFGKKITENVVVFDLGGGTLDVSVLDIDEGLFEVKATRGNMFLGGEDFDYAMMTFIFDTLLDLDRGEKRTNMLLRGRLKNAVEQAKITLSRAKTAVIDLPYLSMKDGAPMHFRHSFDRPALEAIVTPLIRQATDIVSGVLKDAFMEADAIDRVVLVGGSTRMPHVTEALAAVFGRAKLFGALRREDAVALGAAIQAGVLTGNVKDIVLLDVVPQSVGIETLGGVFTRLIDRNTTIPTKKSQVFSTAEDNQSAVTLRVFQGEQELAKDNKLLGQFNLEDIPPAPRGMPQIEVAFDIDANGLLRISANDKGTGKSQQISISQTGSMDESEIDVIKTRLQHLEPIGTIDVGPIDLEEAPKPVRRETVEEAAETSVSLPVVDGDEDARRLPRIMFSYAREDAAWAERIRTSLKPLELQDRLEVLIDTDFAPGTDWQEEIHTAIGRANVVLLLISPDFLASDFIIRTELPAIFAEHERRQVMLIPLHIRPSAFEVFADVAARQAFNNPAQALSGLSDHDVDKELSRLTVTLAQPTTPAA